MGDQRTVDLRDDLSEDLREQAPVLPSPYADVENVGVTGEVMGAIEVQDADKYGGTWGLRLVADFAAQGMDVVEVDERLEEGTYVLLRVDEEVDDAE